MYSKGKSTERGQRVPSVPRRRNKNRSFQSRSTGARGSQLRKIPPSRSQASQSVDEGRTLVITDLSNTVTNDEISRLLQDFTPVIETINIIRVAAGSNKALCFVDFTTRAMAEKAMQLYNGRLFQGRRIKVELKVRPDRNANSFTSGPGSRSRGKYLHDTILGVPAKPDIAMKYDRRLFVRGPPGIQDQAEADAKMRELFNGYNIEKTRLRTAGHGPKDTRPGSHSLCFVDFNTLEEALSACTDLHGQLKWGIPFTAEIARRRPRNAAVPLKPFVPPPMSSDKTFSFANMQVVSGGF